MEITGVLAVIAVLGVGFAAYFAKLWLSAKAELAELAARSAAPSVTRLCASLSKKHTHLPAHWHTRTTSMYQTSRPCLAHSHQDQSIGSTSQTVVPDPRR